MKLLNSDTNKIISPPQVTDNAALLMDVIPLIMNRIRTEMRSRRTPGLSIPQFRTLIYLYRYENASLSQVSEHIGLKLPTSSKIVDALVIRKLIIRNESPDDRRCIRLRLSSIGRDELLRARNITESKLTEILSVLSADQQSEISVTIQTLQSLFVTGKNEFQPDNNIKKNNKSASGGKDD
jgi:DNA-binding MarR family transcriptional regulator